MNSIVLILFFMLSGFLVGGRNNEIFRTNPDFSVKLFTVKRFIRIIPPLAAASILVVIANFITGAATDYGNLIGSIFGLQGIVCGLSELPFWIFPYEIWGYVLLPGVFLIMKKSPGKNLGDFVITVITTAMIYQLSLMWFLSLIFGIRHTGCLK